MDNPFAGQDILIEDGYRERIADVVQLREGKNSTPSRQPFRRNVDIWFFAVMIAVKKGLRPQAPTGKTYKAAEGVVLASDSWRPTALMLLALSTTSDIKVLDSPSEMMKLANSYASAGFPIIFSWLEERGTDTALDYLSDMIEDIID
jgi:hypothetical protein